MACELPLKLGGVGLVFCARTDDNAALFDAALVLGSAVFRNAGANECPQERSRCATGTCAGDGPGNRARHNKADAGNRNRGGRGDQCTERRTDSQANPATDARAFGGFRLFLKFLPQASRLQSGVFACRATSLR